MVEIEHTPNPDTLKFLPGKKVSEIFFSDELLMLFTEETYPKKSKSCNLLLHPS